ncbi:MAG: immunoglobulin domain-containing protein, partial [Verrucomicrobia bacterium]|nr:immunoglobulin domain-containing protein [Verrucomicrobiota bacterium]
NFAYAESDVRSGSQVQYLFSPDYNLTGKSNIYLSYHSIYEQNQDNIGSVEYSVDEGATWLPVVYMVDQDDIIRTEAGDIDAVRTLEEPRGDTATYQDPNTGEDKGGFYGAFIGAPITASLAPYISGRVNDNSEESKRIELFRLPQADNQAKVRLRFAQAGTASWYFGVDNVGFYSITQVEKPSITAQPADASVVVGQSVVLSVTATGLDPTYQWKFAGEELEGKTGATLELSNVQAAQGGLYTVVVSNAGGSTESREATVTVLPPLADNQVLKSALWAYLPFDGNYSDASGSGRNAEARGTPTFAAGKVGTGSLGVLTDSANGVFNYATLGSQVPLDATTDFTVALWVKKNSSDSDPSLIANKDWDSGNNAGFVVFVDGAAVRMNYRSKDVARRDLRGPAVLGAPEWHHVLVSFDRDGDSVLFVDGNPSGSIAIGPAGTLFAEEGAELNIGQDGYGDYSPALNAELDEVAIWGRTLSIQEVAAVYQAGARGESFLAVQSTPTLSYTRDASGNLVITFTGALQSSTTLGGQFAPVAGASSPYTVPAGAADVTFFRSAN